MQSLIIYEVIPAAFSQYVGQNSLVKQLSVEKVFSILEGISTRPWSNAKHISLTWSWSC